MFSIFLPGAVFQVLAAIAEGPLPSWPLLCDSFPTLTVNNVAWEDPTGAQKLADKKRWQGFNCEEGGKKQGKWVETLEKHI